MRVNDILNYLKSNGISFSFFGDSDLEINGYSTTIDACANKMTWLKEGKSIYNTDDNYLVFVKKNFKEEANNFQNISWVFCDDPKGSFFKSLEQFFPTKRKIFISQRSTILTNRIGRNVEIGDNCYIDEDVVIGDDVTIYPNVVLLNKVIIGNRCVIQSFTCMGEDGFGYYESKNGEKTMIKHYGGVTIGDDVFIGMHVDISRGTLGNTSIGKGTKIDDKTHIAHNCIIGDNVTIVESNIWGSVTIGDNAYISGSTIRNQIKIGKNAIVGIGSVVRNDVADYAVVIGNPAQIIRKGREQ